LSPGKKSPGRSEEPQQLGAVLDVLGGERRLAAGLLLGKLGKQWEYVVGERLAAESSPAALEGGVLLIKASSSAWAAQIKFLATEIRESANRLLREGQGLHIWAQRAAADGDRSPVLEVRVILETGPRMT
jgi:predicted nucleic acid-binding Zn ribbon protein